MASRKRLWTWLIAAAVAAAAVLTPWYLGLSRRFAVDGIKINPRAALREDRQYVLVVWEEAVAAPWALQSQRERLNEALGEFSIRYPNVRVELELMDQQTARQRLSQALAAGSPPDVYGAASATGLALPLPLQVPATPYLIEQNEADPPFTGAARDGLTSDGFLWGWPRGLWWDGWLARRDTLERRGFLTTASADGAEGPWLLQDWTYAAVLAAASGEDSPLLSVAVDVTDPDVLWQLLHAFPAGRPDTASSPLPWSEEQVAQAADFIRSLSRSRSRGRDASALSLSRFTALSAGDVAVIGPVNVYGAQSAVRRAPENLVVVPPPAPAGLSPVLPVAPSAYFIFRQAEYKGDDHTRAAAELAAFLASTTEAWFIESLGLLPASTEGWTVWQERAPWNEATRRVLADTPQATGRAIPLPEQPTDDFRRVLTPIWQSYLDGDTTPQQFSASLRAAAEQLLGGPEPPLTGPDG